MPDEPAELCEAVAEPGRTTARVSRAPAGEMAADRGTQTDGGGSEAISAVKAACSGGRSPVTMDQMAESSVAG